MSERSAIRPAGQATLLVAILLLAVLTVAGIALRFLTDTERISAGAEWTVSRAYYAADAGVRWATVQMRDPVAFLSRPEFRDPPNPFGSVAVPFPSHDHGAARLFSGDPDEQGIRVTVQRPSLLGRRPCSTDSEGGAGGFFYLFEVRVQASGAAAPGYLAALVADIEVGPFPADLLDAVNGSPGAGSPAAHDIMDVRFSESSAGSCEPARAFRSISMNWREP